MYFLYIPVIRNIFPDRWYVRCQYRYWTGKKLNLKDLRTFNEKLQWIKLNERDPRLTIMADKYRARSFVSDKIGEKYLIPLIGVYDDFDDINIEDLPEQFVVKCNHDSGSVIIVKNKEKMDVAAVRKKLRRAMRRNYYWSTREWAYKGIEPKIIVEKYLEDESREELKDYKIFCFEGEPKFFQVDFNRFTDHKRNFYSLNWEYMELESEFPTDPNYYIPVPEKLKEMLSIAEVLSEGTHHLRVDLYWDGSDIYFGELTLYHGSGLKAFYPEEMNRVMGGWIDLTRGKRP